MVDMFAWPEHLNVSNAALMIFVSFMLRITEKRKNKPLFNCRGNFVIKTLFLTALYPGLHYSRQNEKAYKKADFPLNYLTSTNLKKNYIYIMKKTLIILFLTISIGLKSQILITLLLGDKLNSDGLEFGLEGGINFTTISGLETSKYDHKWNLGFYFDIRLKNQWYLYTGVLVKSNMGVSKLSENDLNLLGATLYYDITEDQNRVEGNYSQKMNYFLVPVLAKYKFPKHIYAEFGPQFGLMYRSWIEFESKVEDLDAIIKEYNREQLNKIDAGLMFGLGYTLFKGTGWTIGAKYYYGFVDVYKDISGSNNSSFFLKLNIPIGAGEKENE